MSTASQRCSVATELMAVRRWRIAWGPMADQRGSWLLLMIVGRSLVPMAFRRHWIVVVRLQRDPEPKAGQMLGRESRVYQRSRMAAQSLLLEA